MVPFIFICIFAAVGLGSTLFMGDNNKVEKEAEKLIEVEIQEDEEGAGKSRTNSD